MGLKKMKSYPTHNPNCIPPKLTVFDCISKVGAWIFDHTLLAIWNLYVGFLDSMVFSDLGTKGPEVMLLATVMTIVFLGIVEIALLGLLLAIVTIASFTKISLIVIGVIVAIVGSAYAASKCSNY